MSDRTEFYYIGILNDGFMTQCNLVTTDWDEAKRIAKAETKNIYELSNGAYLLRMIYANQFENERAGLHHRPHFKNKLNQR